MQNLSMTVQRLIPADSINKTEQDDAIIICRILEMIHKNIQKKKEKTAISANFFFPVAKQIKLL